MIKLVLVDDCIGYCVECIDDASSDCIYPLGKPYIIQTGEQIPVDGKPIMFKVDNKWFEGDFDSLLGPDIQEVASIIARPEEIGYKRQIDIIEDKKVLGDLKILTTDDINEIIEKGGDVVLEKTEILGDYCGYRTLVRQHGKVIILDSV